MKFKLIFGLFNAIIILAFLFVFFLPLVAGPAQFTFDFWGKNWFIAVLFLLILGILDSYFIVNWRLFTLLEKEDWPGLVNHIHEQITKRNRITDQNIRVICNAYVILNRTAEIKEIEAVIRERRPSLLERHSLVLAVPYILAQDSPKLREFFEPFLNSKTSDRYWIRFFHTFAVMGEGSIDLARPALVDLAVQKTDRLVQLVALYLLGTEGAQGDATLAAARDEFQKSLNRSAALRKIEQSKDLVHVVLLSKILLYPACEWLYAGTESTTKVEGPAS